MAFKAKLGKLNSEFLKKWAESNMALNFQQFTMLNQFANNSGKKRKKQSKIFKYAQERPKRGHSMTARGKSPRKTNISEDLFRTKRKKKDRTLNATGSFINMLA